MREVSASVLLISATAESAFALASSSLCSRSIRASSNERPRKVVAMAKIAPNTVVKPIANRIVASYIALNMSADKVISAAPQAKTSDSSIYYFIIPREDHLRLP